jgi:DNA-binding CsgD family transcriptional regulator
MLVVGGQTTMILERESELAQLAEMLDGIESSGGRVVLVRGEAGIGKSTLINRFLDDVHERAHTLFGACDDLLTPQPFGPIWDVARDEAGLAESLVDGDRRAVMETILDLLMRPLRPTVLVLEDTQWADEATLDLIKFLGRRIARTNGILILTYRDVEVDAEHPLRQVIGQLPAQNLLRMSLGRLSADAVRSMLDQREYNVDEVLALTSGNPLFVTEVLASGTDAVPLSIKDSVLARVAQTSPDARRLLDFVSVVPGDVERSLVDQVLQPTEESLGEGIRQGLLRADTDTLSFAHDLQRRAVESSLRESDRRSLNQQILDTLEGSADPSRLVHHAREANDNAAIVRFAPQAARAAIAAESTTEAAAHFRTLEPYLDQLELSDRADVLDEWGIQEFYLDNADAVDIFDRAIAVRRSANDEHRLARTLTRASRVNRSFARPRQSLDYSSEAVAILEPFGPSSDLATSLSHRAFLEWIYSDEDEEILKIVNRASSIAEEADDDAATMAALLIKGNLVFSHGDMSGMMLIERARALAQRLGDRWGEIVALHTMAGMFGDIRDVERASDFAQRARENASRYEIRTLEADAQAMYSEFLLWKGDWTAAEDASTETLGSNPTIETLAWRVLGTIHTRRNGTGARAAILKMWELARPAEGLTVVDTAAAALAEYIWLSDDRDPDLLDQLENVLTVGIAKGEPWPSGAFAFWMWKLGLLDEAPEGTADFYGWIIKGEYQKSAEFWRDRGIPYEEGLALMHGDEAEQIEAIRIFEALGATATANKVRESLAHQGVKVPRGRSQATRDHAAGLTARQAEVLALLAQGFTNTEIADELFVSQRTVESHVSAVLMKLDVPNREAAVATAQAQGILDSA